MTREFARRRQGNVCCNYFIENPEGPARLERMEALDLSRRVIRESQVLLPRRGPIVEEFATHMAAITKKLDEDDDTSEQKYNYVRSGPDHVSMAFTYCVLGWERESYGDWIVAGGDEDDSRGGGRWIPFNPWGW